MTDEQSPYSAAPQGLGYIYQARLALLRLLSLPERWGVLLEKEDDVEFLLENGRRSLASLKHKAVGDELTDLSIDFWKSVRVWLAHYKKTGRIASESRFILLTTSAIAGGSFLEMFGKDHGDEAKAKATMDAGRMSRSRIVTAVVADLDQLTEEEVADFFGRVEIFDGAPRVTDIPSLIDKYLRTVRREAREAVFQRLEGWWTDQAIKLLAGERIDPISGWEVSDKLSRIADEYRGDNLPITFRNKVPDGEIDVEADPRLFVEQLRALDLSAARIRIAIIDYYRAFEQRSSWARESLLVSGEMEEYEDRLVEEWARYREIYFETLNDDTDDRVCVEAGRTLYTWAETETSMLRIRERVTEPYVVRGGFHILANHSPEPRVHWHPRFMERLGKLLEVAA